LFHGGRDRRRDRSTPQEGVRRTITISTTGRYLHLISPQFRVPKEIDPLDLLAALRLF
jgi:hypothetical protein